MVNQITNIRDLILYIIEIIKIILTPVFLLKFLLSKKRITFSSCIAIKLENARAHTHTQKRWIYPSFGARLFLP